MSLGLGLGLGISGGSGPRPDFDWIANGAFRDALTEAARSGFAAGFSSPASREQYWLRGVSYPSFLSVPGATYTRTGSRAGLDAAVIYYENLIRSSDNLQAGGWNVADGGAITGANSATLTTNLLSRIQAGTITTPAGTTTTVSVELAGSGTVEIHNKDGSGAFGRNVLTVVLTPTLTRYSVTRTSVDFNTILAINGVGTAVTNLTIRNAQCVIGNVAGPYIPNPSTTLSASQPRIAPSSGLRVHGAGTNEARNSTAAGGTVGVIGSGGVLPTNWIRISNSLTTEIVSISGDAVRLRFSGTPSSGFVELGLTTPAQAPVSPGQIWTGSRYARIVAGTLPAGAGNGFVTTIHRFNSGGSYVDQSSSFTIFNGSAFVRGTHTSTALPAGTAFIATNWIMYVDNGVPCDFTVEIASPQLEQSAFATDYIPNPNTGASSSAGADDVLVNLTTAGIDVNRPMTLIYQYVNSGNQDLNSAEAALFQNSAPSTNRISSRSQPANQVLYTRSGTGAAPSFNAPTPTVGSLVTAAISVSAGQIAIARTGNASVSSLAVGGSPLAIDRLGIGKTEGSALYSNTGIQAVALIPRALSDAELLALVA